MNTSKLISITNASNSLKAIRPLIETAKSSHYQIMVNNVIYDLYRMSLQKFKRYLNNAADRQTYLENPSAYVSIEQLNMFIATYNRNTEFKKYLIFKLNMIKSCLIDKRVAISYDTFTTNICLAANALPY